MAVKDKRESDTVVGGHGRERAAETSSVSLPSGVSPLS